MFVRFDSYVVRNEGDNLMRMALQFEAWNNKIAYFKGPVAKKTKFKQSAACI
jgi:hypothetical protein